MLIGKNAGSKDRLKGLGWRGYIKYIYTIQYTIQYSLLSKSKVQCHEIFCLKFYSKFTLIWPTFWRAKTTLQLQVWVLRSINMLKNILHLIIKIKMMLILNKKLFPHFSRNVSSIKYLLEYMYYRESALSQKQYCEKKCLFVQ